MQCKYTSKRSVIGFFRHSVNKKKLNLTLCEKMETYGGDSDRSRFAL